MIKLSEIINSQESFAQILALKLPVKIAYKISKVLNRIQPDLKIYEEQRVKLIKDLGEQTDKEKDMWRVKTENVDKYNEEIAKLGSVELDISYTANKSFEKIKVEELGDINIEPTVLSNLNWLFE